MHAFRVSACSHAEKQNIIVHLCCSAEWSDQWHNRQVVVPVKSILLQRRDLLKIQNKSSQMCAALPKAYQNLENLAVYTNIQDQSAIVSIEVQATSYKFTNSLTDLDQSNKL